MVCAGTLYHVEDIKTVMPNRHKAVSQFRHQRPEFKYDQTAASSTLIEALARPR